MILFENFVVINTRIDVRVSCQSRKWLLEIARHLWVTRVWKFCGIKFVQSGIYHAKIFNPKISDKSIEPHHISKILKFNRLIVNNDVFALWDFQRLRLNFTRSSCDRLGKQCWKQCTNLEKWPLKNVRDLWVTSDWKFSGNKFVQSGIYHAKIFNPEIFDKSIEKLLILLLLRINRRAS